MDLTKASATSGAKVGLVLSGGGVRGAYEVGVLAGIIEALGLSPSDRAPFDIFAGTSVGAINAAFMVANAHRGDMNINELVDIWGNLTMRSHLRLNVRRSSGDSLVPRKGLIGRSLVDARPLELLVKRSASWERLHDNIRTGVVSALLVAAFDIATGATTVFSEMAPGSCFSHGKDVRKNTLECDITADHVLASAAIPFVFPSRKVGERYYCDGGVRFNTPLAPAIRAGADKLVIISLQVAPEQRRERHLTDYPSAALIAGKLLNSLLLDPFQHDLAILARFNHLMHALEDVLTPEEMAKIDRVLIESRGAPYRRLEPLVFVPSVDIGELAGEHLRGHLDDWDLGAIPKLLLRRASRQDATWEADWAAYVIFDGSFARQLIEIGLSDARSRAAEIRAFFAP